MRKLLLSIVAMLFCVYSYAQSPDDFKPKLPDFVPPSPTAFELGKYGDIPVNESTGMANISVPLYTYSTPNLSVPISLSYTTSGIKVDQVASWVGLGWNLNAGASISRNIRGMADEEAQVRKFIDYTTLNGLKTSDPSEYYSNISKIAAKDHTDYVPDIFNYSIDGYSGSFYLDANWSAVFIKKESEVKASIINNSITNGFIITTPKGVKYTFTIIEHTKQRMTCGSGNSNPTSFKPTSWLLTKITHPFGDEITFTYGNSTTYFYTTSLTETYAKNNPNVPPTGATLPPEGFTKCWNDTHVNGQVLTKISSNRNIGEIDFVSTKSRSDINDYKLDDIIIKDAFNNQIKKYSFGYTQTQSTISFNGASNFSGAAGNDKKYRLFLDDVTEKDANNNSVNGRKHSFEYESRNNLPKRLSMSKDLLGYYNGKTNWSLLPNPQASNFNITGGDRSFDFNHAKKGILTKVTYPTKGYTIIEYESGLSAIRVKKIRSLAKVGGTEKIVRYYYSSMSDAVAGITGSPSTPIGSSGFIVSKQAVVTYSNPLPGSIGNYQFYFNRIEFTDKGLAPMYMTNAHHFLYSTVTIGYGDNFEGGGVEKKFDVTTESNALPIHGEQILDGVKTNSGLLNGNLVEENYFKKENNSAVVVKKVEYTYNNTGVNYTPLDGYIGNVVYDSPIGTQSSLNGNLGNDVSRIQTISKWQSIDEVKTTEYLSGGNIVTIQKSNYTTNSYAGLPNEVTTSNSLNGITNKVKYYYPSSSNNALLFNTNRLEVLKTEQFESTSSTVPSYTTNNVYGTRSNLYLPIAVQTSVENQALEDRIVFHNYDNKGNVTEVSKKDGSKIYYVWGYNQTKPIAQITGYSSFTTAQNTLIAEAVTASNNDSNQATENTLRAKLKNLRDGFPNAQVNTYTYNPLIGVTSVTDARGRTTYYQYNSFNRLEYVKDHEGNILSKNQYNYKN